MGSVSDLWWRSRCSVLARQHQGRAPALGGVLGGPGGVPVRLGGWLRSVFLWCSRMASGVEKPANPANPAKWGLTWGFGCGVLLVGCLEKPRKPRKEMPLAVEKPRKPRRLGGETPQVFLLVRVAVAGFAGFCGFFCRGRFVEPSRSWPWRGSRLRCVARCRRASGRPGRGGTSRGSWC